MIEITEKIYCDVCRKEITDKGKSQYSDDNAGHVLYIEVKTYLGEKPRRKEHFCIDCDKKIQDIFWKEFSL